jgi:hypothetical protein
MEEGTPNQGVMQAGSMRGHLSTYIAAAAAKLKLRARVQMTLKHVAQAHCWHSEHQNNTQTQPNRFGHPVSQSTTPLPSHSPCTRFGVLHLLPWQQLCYRHSHQLNPGLTCAATLATPVLAPPPCRHHVIYCYCSSLLRATGAAAACTRGKNGCAQCKITVCHSE